MMSDLSALSFFPLPRRLFTVINYKPTTTNAGIYILLTERKKSTNGRGHRRQRAIRGLHLKNLRRTIRPPLFPAFGVADLVPPYILNRSLC